MIVCGGLAVGADEHIEKRPNLLSRRDNKGICGAIKKFLPPLSVILKVCWVAAGSFKLDEL